MIRIYKYNSSAKFVEIISFLLTIMNNKLFINVVFHELKNIWRNAWKIK